MADPTTGSSSNRTRNLRARPSAERRDAAPVSPSRHLDEADTHLAPDADASEIRPAYVAGYEILDELGRGGMGVVYRARDAALDRIVALKMILGARFACPDEVVRFRLEGETAARLQHPNVVQVHDVGTHNGQPFLVLEYVEGGTLSQRLKESRPGVAEAAKLVAVLARAVHAAHVHGIIHRDMKPSNVLLTDDGTPKITDFGLAKNLDRGGELTETGRVLGTPEYMAPEQAAGRSRQIGPHTDVYSLGVMLFQMLAGRPPFQATATMDTMIQVLSCDAPPLRRFAAKVPRDLETVCAKCLEKEPARRYASAAELADDLERFLDGRPTLARPVGFAERSWMWARRRPVIAGLLASLVLVSAAGFAGVMAAFFYALAGWHEADDQRTAAESARGREAEERRMAEAARGRETVERKAAEKARVAADTLRVDAVEAKRRAETNVTFSRLTQARLEWRLNNLPASLSLLDQIEEPRRGWEWQHLRGLHKGELLTLSRKPFAVMGRLSFSPDGRHVVAAGGNPFHRLDDGAYPGGVVVWDVRDGNVVRVLSGFRHAATSAAYSPDGTRIAASSLDGQMRVWDSATGRLLHRHRARVQLLDMAWSPDGRALLSGGNGGAIVWEIETDRIARLHEDNNTVGTLAWHPSGKLIASAAGETRLHEWPSGKRLRGLGYGADALAFSPDGKRLAVSSASTVRIFDATAERLLAVVSGHDGRVGGVAFSPDSRQLATAGADTTVRVWDADTGTQRSIWRGHLGRANAVAFHPDGWVVASSGSQPGDVRLWDLTRQQEALRIDAHAGNSWIEAVAFDAAGTRLHVCRPGQGIVETYDSVTLESKRVRHVDVARRLVAPGTRAAFSADGSRMAAFAFDQRTARVWDVATWKPFPCPTLTLTDQAAVSISGNGRRVAVTFAGMDADLTGELIVREVDSGKVLLWRDLTGQLPTLVQLNHDGTLAACVVRRFGTSNDKRNRTIARPIDEQVEVWDVPAAGQPQPDEPRWRLKAPGKGTFGLAFDEKNRRLAASSHGGKVRVWDVTTGRVLPSGELEGPEMLEGLAFSPDGLLLAGASRTDVVLWNVREGLEVYRLRGAPPRATDLAFSPRVLWSADGRRLAATNWDRSVGVWDIMGDGSPTSARRQREAAEARSARWHLDRGNAACEARDFAAAAFHLDRLDRRALAGDMRQGRGNLAGRMGLWDRAVRDHFGSIDLIHVHDPVVLRRYAVLSAYVRDANRFAQCRDATLAEFGDLPDYQTRAAALAVCALMPPGRHRDRLLRMAGELMRHPGKGGWQIHVCALVNLRAGLDAQAIDLAKLSLSAEPEWVPVRPMNALVLAQAHHRRGEMAEARKHLDEARAWRAAMMKDAGDAAPPASVSWADWLQLGLFLAETEKLLGPK